MHTQKFTDPSELPPVTIIRRKRQRTMRIRVRKDGIIVSGPSTVSKKRLLGFVQEKSGWIYKNWSRQLQRRQMLDELRDRYRGTLLLRGDRKPVRVVPVHKLRKPVLVENGQDIIYRHESGNGSSQDRCGPFPSPELVMAFYRNTAVEEIPDRVAYWSNRLPFQPSRISIRNQKTKWGSCSARGTISLNWRLIKCPAAIKDYIIIHELCHLRHFNHSRDFWRCVETFYPDVLAAKKWIKKNSDEIFSDF
ncbi:SprT family zinc-dependent metalloprotease [Balneolales bacterium ANBcel1]|nr:SprT family zinc-dependent metalloprotease [Balneolales bacterium ANBcel1]